MPIKFPSLFLTFTLFWRFLSLSSLTGKQTNNERVNTQCKKSVPPKNVPLFLLSLGEEVELTFHFICSIRFSFSPFSTLWEGIKTGIRIMMWLQVRVSEYVIIIDRILEPIPSPSFSTHTLSDNLFLLSNNCRVKRWQKIWDWLQFSGWGGVREWDKDRDREWDKDRERLSNIWVEFSFSPQFSMKLASTLSHQMKGL